MVRKDDGEESTRIRSASEIEEMARKSRSHSVPDASEFDAHTQVGRLDELVARTRASDQPTTPTSANVIRRGSSPVMVPPRAAGSHADILGAKREVDDDTAFAELEAGAPAPPTFGAAERPLPLPAPPASLPTVAAKLPVLPQARPRVRWGVVAWFALLAAMIGVGSIGYLRIMQLEDALAAANAKLAK